MEKNGCNTEMVMVGPTTSSRTPNTSSKTVAATRSSLGSPNTSQTKFQGATIKKKPATTPKISFKSIVKKKATTGQPLRVREEKYHHPESLSKSPS
jgi:hypothetical protein